MTLSQKQIQTIWAAYEQSGSVRGAWRLVDFPLSTVYKYCEQKFEIKRQQKAEQKSDDELLIGIYVGLWMGDGSQYMDRGRCIVKFCTRTDARTLNKFIRKIILDLFGITTHNSQNNEEKGMYIKFNSRYVYDWINQYASWQDIKTYSVKLQNLELNRRFYTGYLIGIILSDGYIKKRTCVRSVSPGIAKATKFAFEKLGFKPKTRLNERKNPNWKSIYSVSIETIDTRKLIGILDNSLIEIGWNKSITSTKYE